MKFVCVKCGTKYTVSDEKIQGVDRQFRIRCKICQDPIVINGVDTKQVWHYAVGPTITGPFSLGEMKAKIGDLIINDQTFVWKFGMVTWAKLQTIEELRIFLSSRACEVEKTSPFEQGVDIFTAFDSKPLSYTRQENSVLFDLAELGLPVGKVNKEMKTETSDLIDIKVLNAKQVELAAFNPSFEPSNSILKPDKPSVSGYGSINRLGWIVVGVLGLALASFLAYFLTT